MPLHYSEVFKHYTFDGKSLTLKNFQVMRKQTNDK